MTDWDSACYLVIQVPSLVSGTVQYSAGTSSLFCMVLVTNLDITVGWDLGVGSKMQLASPGRRSLLYSMNRIASYVIV